MNLLTRLYRQDIQDRSSQNWDKATKDEFRWLENRDDQRKTQVLLLHKNGQIRSASGFHHAALILQHGTTPSDFELAHQFARKAVSLGDDTARWLFAATLDRWLLSTMRPQKFGTQFKKDQNGDWVLALPIDKTVTDEDRRQYNVPNLGKILPKLKDPERNRI